ncbi:MFS general substrate transporter [Dacryopinax primogenitus]|uniref:MFS general substrate transporter n=1 Tax=Dacryopinax primogenitus (strain DJM 731) TaxID=1858805 RepID=M5FVD9_DACPD|nr:MFS general substrate transporter [Dacryopinax primogenitus]EJU01761.1 MFS general substrate transporter [Dacryopinax primogenitus]
MSNPADHSFVDEEKGAYAHAESPSTTAAGAPDGVKPEHHVIALGQDDVKLGWRSWLAVFVSCFAIFAQVFVVTSAPTVIAFIVRDLGDAPLSGWIVQAPILMQSALSPVVGRLSDLVNRKYMAAIPPIIAVVGSILCAEAKNMSWLVGGGILIGSTLATISIVQSIPSEVLPLKYRTLANGYAYLAGAIGGTVGGLGSGAVIRSDPGGWRKIFWMQCAFHAFTAFGLLVFYHPPPVDYPKMPWRKLVWMLDPIGSFLLVGGSAIALLAFDWSSGTYPWSSPAVIAPLVIGLIMLIAFCIYEWLGRSDGIAAHVFFQRGRNFPLSLFAFGVEGFIFYSAVAQFTPQIVLNLGFETDSWKISIRQLSYGLTSLFASIPIIWYSTRYKDVKSPLIFTFLVFFAVCVCYAVITPNDNSRQIGYNVLSGIGQSGPLTLLVAVTQFTAPHAYLATATGLAFSARAIGGAFGSAIMGTIVNSKLTNYGTDVGNAAIAAGLPESSVSALLAAFATGAGFDAVPGINDSILAAATSASQWTYAYAYRYAWITIIPFTVVAIIAVAMLRGVKELMTNHVEATVEKVGMHERPTDDPLAAQVAQVDAIEREFEAHEAEAHAHSHHGHHQA